MNSHSPKPKTRATTYFQIAQNNCTLLIASNYPKKLFFNKHGSFIIILSSDKNLFADISPKWQKFLCFCSSLLGCFLPYINNRQQAAAHNVVVDKLKGIEESLHEICNNRNWVRPHRKYRRSNSPKPTKSYDGDVLTLGNEFKQLFDAKRKLNESSLSEMYCKIKSEIKDLGKCSIGASAIAENFYKCKTNPRLP
jgi:hypothetical protein